MAPPSERSEPRPEPLSTVPFRRDPDFVGRNEILNQLHEKASIAGSTVALFGLGGVGYENHGQREGSQILTT